MQLFHFLTAVTHMDWHFGMVLQALEDSGQANDTIVTMTGGEWAGSAPAPARPDLYNR